MEDIFCSQTIELTINNNNDNNKFIAIEAKSIIYVLVT
jgi:hypothetical protein